MDVANMRSPPAFGTFGREPGPLSQTPHASRSTMVIAGSSWLTINLPRLFRYEGSMPLSTACKGIVKVQLRICDNHSRSFTGADVPFGACRVTLQACSSLCEQVQKMCSGKRAGSSQPTREGCSPSIVQFWEPTGGLEPPTCVRRRWITRRRFLCKRDMQLRMRVSTQPHRRL